MSYDIDNRVFYLDLLRAYFIIFIPLVHVMGVWTVPGSGAALVEEASNIHYLLINVSFAYLMVALGFNMAFSKRVSPRYLMVRGLIILGVGIALNIFQSLILEVLAYALGSDPPNMEVIVQTLSSDILPLAGTSLILFGVFLKLKLNPLNILTIAVLMMVINYIPISIDIEADTITHEVIYSILGNFLFIDEHSSFALFTWFIFPAVGYNLGPAMKRLSGVNGDEQWPRRIGLAIAATALIIVTMNRSDTQILGPSDPATAYFLDLYTILLMLCCCMALLGCAFFVSKLFKSKRKRRAISSLSRTILVFYVLQWVIVSVLCFVTEVTNVYMPLQEPGILVKLLVSLIITVVTIVLSLRIQRWLDSRREWMDALVSED